LSFARQGAGHALNPAVFPEEERMMSRRWWTITVLVLPLIAALSAQAISPTDEQGSATIIFGVS